MKEREVVGWVESLTDKQFVDFFYAAVASRSTSDFSEWNGHFLLANAEKLPGEPWEIDLIARHDPGNEWPEDSPICQSGICSQCSNTVRSISKNAICPVCDAKVYCT